MQFYIWACECLALGKVVHSNSLAECADGDFTSVIDMHLHLSFGLQRIYISENHVSSFLFFGHLVSLVLGLARSRVTIAPVKFHSDMNGSNFCSLGEG